MKEVKQVKAFQPFARALGKNSLLVKGRGFIHLLHPFHQEAGGDDHHADDMQARAEKVARVFGFDDEPYPCTVCGEPADASLGFGTRCREHQS